MAPARITQEAILTDVRRLAVAHPRLTWAIIRREGRYSGRMYERGAPGLDALIRLAGLPPRAPAVPSAPLPAALTALAAWPEEQVVAVWRAVRWPDQVNPADDRCVVCCPRCGDAASVSTIPTQRLGPSGALAVYGCADCAYHFSDITESVFHGLMMPLGKKALVLVAARLGVPLVRLTAWGVNRDRASRTARGAADSSLAQRFIDRLLAIATAEAAG